MKETKEWDENHWNQVTIMEDKEEINRQVQVEEH